MASDRRRAIITGGTGFLGTHLAKRLEAIGYDVWTHSRSGARLTGDIADAAGLVAAFSDVRPAVVFHLAGSTAGRSGADGVEDALRINVTGALNVMRAALAAGCTTVVQTSTSQACGRGAAVPLREDATLRPASGYALSKATNEMMGGMFSTTSPMGVVSLRLPLAYGPGQRPTMLIPDLIQKALSHEPFVMTKGEQQRDFVYVDDVIDALVLAAERPAARGEVINVGSGRPVAVRDVVRMVLARLGDPIVPRMDQPYRAGEDMCSYVDIQKAARLLDWHPTVSLEEGLTRTVDWYVARR